MEPLYVAELVHGQNKKDVVVAATILSLLGESEFVWTSLNEVNFILGSGSIYSFYSGDQETFTRAMLQSGASDIFKQTMVALRQFQRKILGANNETESSLIGMGTYMNDRYLIDHNAELIRAGALDDHYHQHVAWVAHKSRIQRVAIPRTSLDELYFFFEHNYPKREYADTRRTLRQLRQSHWYGYVTRWPIENESDFLGCELWHLLCRFFDVYYCREMPMSESVNFVIAVIDRIAIRAQISTFDVEEIEELFSKFSMSWRPKTSWHFWKEASASLLDTKIAEISAAASRLKEMILNLAY